MSIYNGKVIVQGTGTMVAANQISHTIGLQVTVEDDCASLSCVNRNGDVLAARFDIEAEDFPVRLASKYLGIDVSACLEDLADGTHVNYETARRLRRFIHGDCMEAHFEKGDNFMSFCNELSEMMDWIAPSGFFTIDGQSMFISRNVNKLLSIIGMSSDPELRVRITGRHGMEINGKHISETEK